MVSPAGRNSLERPQTKVLKLSKNGKKRQQKLYHIHAQDRDTTSTLHEVEKISLNCLALPCLIVATLDFFLLW